MSDEPLGSVGEEAAKLLEALQDWRRRAGEGQGSAKGGLAAVLLELNEHVATGGDDCTYCPVCRAIRSVRSTSPEVRTHLAVAATSLLQAAAGLLATEVPVRDDDSGEEPHP